MGKRQAPKGRRAQQPTCKQKVTYATREEANKAAEAISRRKGRKMYGYPCQAFRGEPLAHRHHATRLSLARSPRSDCLRSYSSDRSPGPAHREHDRRDAAGRVLAPRPKRATRALFAFPPRRPTLGASSSVPVASGFPVGSDPVVAERLVVQGDIGCEPFDELVDQPVLHEGPWHG